MNIDAIGLQATSPPGTQPKSVQAPEKVILDKNKSESSNEEQREAGTFRKNSKRITNEAVEEMNDFLKPIRRNLKFEMHDKLDRYYVTVINSETSEVIKEIPPKEFLDMYAKMAEFMGLLVDQKV